MIRIRMEDHFSDTYGTIWVQRGGKPSQKNILVTLFPIDGSNYTMVFLKGLSEITYNTILDGVLKDLIPSHKTIKHESNLY